MTALQLPTKKVTKALLTAMLVAAATSSEIPENNLLSAGERDLFHDDENFWSRFVEEVTSSELTPSQTPDATPGPTPNPSPAPTPSPTPSPTREPSSSPTDYCETEADISCIDERGIPCDQLVSPEGACVIGNDIDTIALKLAFGTCKESRNRQSGFLNSCEDQGTLPGPGESVQVTCTDQNNSQLYSNTIEDGTSILLQTNNGFADSISCLLYTTSGDLVQQVVIITSENADLFMNDKFGSFELISCNEKRCITDVTYSYTIFNIGLVPVTVTTFERTRSDTSDNLLPSLVSQDIPPQSTASVTETETIDLCADGEYSTIATIEAFPPSGLVCPAEADYFFNIDVGCRVDVSIECMAEDGTECSQLQPPPGSCSLTGSPIFELKFQYVACTCDESANSQDEASCSDLEPFPAGPATISCAAAEDDTVLTVSPNQLSQGDTLVVTSADGAALPSEVVCTIMDGSVPVQQFSFFTAGGEDLRLKDKFGSFELLGCQDESGSAQDCEVLLCYLYELENVGTNDMDITLLQRTRDGATESLFDLLDVTTLRPGDETSVTEKELIDICLDGAHTTSVQVEADPPNGITCFDEDTYTFETAVGCKVDVDITCMSEDGIECSKLESPYGQCNPSGGLPVIDLKLRITGHTCEESASGNAQSGSFCSDSNPLPNTTLDVSCTGSDGTAVVVEPRRVVQGDTIIISDPVGEYLPLEIICFLADGGTPIQEVRFSTILPLTLKDQFGSFELEACSSSDGQSLDCLALLCYEYDMTNVGANNMDISLMNRTRNGETESFLDLLTDTSLVPGQSTQIVEKGVVDLCIQSQFRTKVEVEAIPPNGITCYGDDMYQFEMTPTPVPSPSPSKAPTLAPTLEPTPGPTPAPTLEPSPIPTPLPTPGPTLVPTPGPTPLPTPEPTPGPTPEPTPGATPLPTPEPTPGPTPLPTPGPTPVPTPETTPGPTPAPTPEPTPVPTPSPTLEPTPMPTPGPTPVPTLAPSPIPSAEPSAAPTELPSNPPSSPPSQSPTETPCVFDMDVECIPPVGAASCNATPPPVEQCSGRPFEMVFLYNGGGCDQSYNVQEADGKFSCTDFEGGPPTEKGEKSFIVVTALRDDVVYHSGWVGVGELFTLSDGGQDFVADQLITIFQNDDVTDPGNIIQSVQYHSSCSSNLFLKDRFGAVQLVTWVNEEQGTVSCFANQTFELDITVPIDIVGGPATIQSLTIASNVDPFFFNLTEQISGIEVDAGDRLQTSLSIPLDLTQKRTYNLLITLSALTTTGKECLATALTSFTAGYPLPPIFPTFAPTQAPTRLPR